MLDKLTDGSHEIVLGSRFLGRTVDMPYSRRLLLKAATLFTRVVSGLRVTDTHNGLRAFTRRAAGCIKITLDRMAHASELLDHVHRSGLAYTEVPVTIRYTDYSRAKGQRGGAAFRILFDYLWGRIVR
jgi:polyprenyl-phospho-N-acetylgalactosaminyl synthase